MLSREQCLKLATDAERRKAIPAMSVYDWDIVADWENETEDEEYRRIFHTASCSMYHRMELREGAL